ncbi:diguanylate cyclase [compost metagenome]
MARIGGDEFIVLLPATDERGALAMEERIVSLLELNNQFYPGHTIHLAMGHAVGHEGASMEAVVHRADQSMYADKERFYESKERDRRSSSTTT